MREKQGWHESLLRRIVSISDPLGTLKSESDLNVSLFRPLLQAVNVTYLATGSTNRPQWYIWGNPERGMKEP